MYRREDEELQEGLVDLEVAVVLQYQVDLEDVVVLRYQVDLEVLVVQEAQEV